MYWQVEFGTPPNRTRRFGSTISEEDAPRHWFPPHSFNNYWSDKKFERLTSNTVILTCLKSCTKRCRKCCMEIKKNVSRKKHEWKFVAIKHSPVSIISVHILCTNRVTRQNDTFVMTFCNVDEILNKLNCDLLTDYIYNKPLQI